MDKIDEIVDKAIQYTEDILTRAPQHYTAARAGLEQMRENLNIGAQGHEALQKLETYLNELDRPLRPLNVTVRLCLRREC